AREDDASRTGPRLAIACRPGAPARLGGESREHRTVERITHEDRVTMALAEKAEVSTVRVCRIERKEPIGRVVEDGVGIQDGLVALSRRTEAVIHIIESNRELLIKPAQAMEDVGPGQHACSRDGRDFSARQEVAVIPPAPVGWSAPEGPTA